MKSIIYKKAIFSCAYRRFRADLSEAENRELFAEDYTDESLGSNFELWAGLKGENLADAELARFEEDLQVVKRELDHKFLNENLEYFKLNTPSLENIAKYCWQKLGLHFKGRVSLRLVEPGFDTCTIAEDGQISIERNYKLNCVHKHFDPNLTEAENAELYGKCSGLHGHEYQLTVGLGGNELKQEVLAPRQKIDDIVHQFIIKPFDKTYLNEHIGNTSGEIILEKFYEILRPQIEDQYKLNLKLQETRKNSFFISDESSF